MTTKTQEAIKFIEGCYPPVTECEREVLQMMCAYLHAGQFKLDTSLFDGIYQNVDDLTEAVADSMETGWDMLRYKSDDEDDDEDDDWTVIFSIPTNEVDWRKVAKAVWGNDIEEYINENFPKSPVAVWLTRHEILPEQIEWFESRGFEVKTLHDYADGDETMFRFASGTQAWQLANDVAGRTLREGDVVFAILTDSHKPDFLRLAQENDVKWLATKMEYTSRTPNGVETVWSGTFDVVIRVFEAEYEPFEPASKPTPFTFLTGGRFDAERFVPEWSGAKPPWDFFAEALIEFAKNNSDASEAEIRKAWAKEKSVVERWFDEFFKQRNPFIVAMGAVDSRFYEYLNPLLFDTVDGWMDEVESDTDEHDVFNPHNEDWTQAREDAWDTIYYWFEESKYSPTQEQVNDAIEWLENANDEASALEDLRAMLEEIDNDINN